MISLIQFPLTDLRFFLPEEERAVLSKPTWITPQEDQFVRSFGNLRRRRGVSVASELIGERYYCHASNILSLLPTHFVEGDEDECLYRNLFNNGHFTLRYELGFIKRQTWDNVWDNVWDNFNRHTPVNYQFKEIVDQVGKYLSMPVRVGSKPKPSFYTLFNVGTPIANNYEHVSTKKTKTVSNESLVKAGEPLAIVICPYSVVDLPEQPEMAKYQVGSTMVRFSFHIAKIDNKKFKLWIISPDRGHSFRRKEDFEKLRSLRISLMRIHSERESMKIVIDQIQPLHFNKYSHVAESYQAYLKYLHKLLSKQNDPVLKLAIQSDSLATNFELKDYFEHIKVIHPQLFERHKQIIMKTNNITNTGGNVVIIEGGNSGNINQTNSFIQDSYNTVANSGMSEEMKQQFKELLGQIDEGAKDLPQDHKTELAKEVKTMTDAATEGKSGLSKFLTSSGKVMEFIKNTAKVAAVVGATIAKIVALF